MTHRFFLLFFAFLILFPRVGWSQRYGQVQNNFTNNKISGSFSGDSKGLGEDIKGSLHGSSGNNLGTIEYQVHLLGQVRQPGTYRVPPSTRLDEALNRAGGLSERGSLRSIELRRDKKVYRYDLFKFERQGDLGQNPFLLDNDVVFVPFAQDSVAINGPVKSAGTYELINDKSLWNLIQLSGGFTVGISQNEPVTVIRYDADGKKILAKVSNTKQDLESFVLQNGDIVVVPHIFLKDRRFDYSVAELPADTQFYPTQKNEIYITGAISQPGAYPFHANYSIRDFINTAGITEMSNSKGLSIMTADGKFIRNPESKKGFRLSPGDTIYVPKRQWTTANVLGWYNTTLNTALSVYAWKQVFR